MEDNKQTIFKLITNKFSYFIFKNNENKYFAILQSKKMPDINSSFFDSIDECYEWANGYLSFDLKSLVIALMKSNGSYFDKGKEE